MTPQALKASLLQRAIQGKLVEQRPEEGSAEALYTQIQAEKAALIKAGKLKKDKPLPEITADELPFDIPSTWKWVRLREIVYNRGQIIPQTRFSYIDIGSIDNKYQRLNAEENLIEAKDAPSRARRIVEKGDILYSTVRPYLHNMCIVDKGFSEMPIASTGLAAMTCHTGVYNKFLFYFLMSPAFDEYANHTENAKGVAYPAINDNRLYRALIPLPPLAAQKRIVERIERLLPLVERYEAAWERLNAFNKRFPADLQKSLLQMAIQGKLVEQRPEEGTAEALYTQIQAEKAALIKAGKLKKDKPLPEITADELPFDIPPTWKWVRLGECGVLKNGYAFKSHEYVETGVQVIRISDLGDGELSTRDAVYHPLKEELEPFLVLENSFLICMTGSIGKMTWIKDKTLRYLNQRVGMFIPFSTIGCAYLWNFLQTSRVRDIWNNAKTSTNGNIKSSDITDLLIPLPPLAEQQRIVERLEQLLALTQQLC